MLSKFICIVLVFIFSSIAFAQNAQRPSRNDLTAEESLQFIATDLQRIARQLENLNKDIVKAYSNISSSLGLSLTESQQKLLVSFEILNRAELRLSYLQKTRFDLLEKQTQIKTKLTEVEISLKEENIERDFVSQGTTNANDARDKRREMLNTQKNDFNNLLFEIQTNLAQINLELYETSQLVNRLRSTLFPAIHKELIELDKKQ